VAGRGVLLFASCVALLAGSRTAAAQEVDAPASAQAPEFHGFVSQGFIVTTDNDYLAHTEDQVSFEFTEVGLNATSALTDTLRAGMQLFARDLGPDGDYKATFDWFYLDYRWRDWLGVRAGRVKLPFGLYNDVVDIDAARNPILPPQSIYPVENRDFLLAQTGAEVYGYLDLGAGGALDYRLNGGTIFLELEEQPGSPVTPLETRIPYVFGGRVLWEAPVQGLRLGGSLQALRLETDLLVPMTPMPVSADIDAVLWVASAEYSVRDLVVAAEYSRWHLSLETSDPMLFPEEAQVNERGYAAATYRLSSLLQSSLYYSVMFPDTDERSGRAARQHDLALTLRFDLNLYWILKLEGHYMNGTAGLSSALNDSRPQEELTENWALFLAKTTAFF
jgi:hypothetical protein